MGARAVRSAWIVLLVGLAVLVVGIGLSLSGSVSCGAAETPAGNRCITQGDGIARAVEQAGSAGHPAAPLALGVGGVLAAAGVWLVFFADRSVRPATGVGDRIELARRNGWRFLDVDRELLADWADNPDFGADQPAYAVLRGSYEELEFVVFDFRRPGSGQAGTAWIVYLPYPSRTFVEWATTQQPLYRRPLHMVGVRADAIVDIGREQHRSTEPGAVLRQVRALAEIVRRFETQAAASS
ncbi:hypothetical protein Aph02nite_49250 [Actinoplanes philippinensis]|uniref:Uncharacterized protein n=1 Tax=Actinoplanes philippinensis TaxID=35752 RepID=A0A1I2IS63_9ACTN|nr:hypothetical protein [Actinoplanes philippinensis]GIE78975.1 hypothetical protein Aph02nite_49250 [Actinoplanes philippinensis]SFF45262.1 hypothetical protein SAMN05421541_110435 [Actinoplanes philippinensis]